MFGNGMSRRSFLLGGATLAAGGMLGMGLGGGTAWAADPVPILDCDAWGARPNNGVVDVRLIRPVKIIVHHTAGRNTEDTSLDSAIAIARAIQRFHMDTRGWLDSGQQFTISRGAHILEGRRRSLEALRRGNAHVVGAHCAGQNLVSVGIENDGLYIDVDPPTVLFDRLREMCAYICRQYGIAPTEIYGHRDYRDTACPGDRLYGMLPRLRSEVAALLGRGVDAEQATKAGWPLLRVGDRGPAVTAAQHLLRDVGVTEVVPDGHYDDRLADVVRGFQAAIGDLADDDGHEITGMLGGHSWPLLARTVRVGEGSEAERAVEALLAGRAAESVPDEVTPAIWQRLLGTAGSPRAT